MIFNYCIYGDITPNYQGEVILNLYDSNLVDSYTKTYESTDSKYQFNLGDRDLFNINHLLLDGSSVVISVNDKFYFLKLDLSKQIVEFNIDLNETQSKDSSIASDSDNLLEYNKNNY